MTNKIAIKKNKGIAFPCFLKTIARLTQRETWRLFFLVPYFGADRVSLPISSVVQSLNVEKLAKQRRRFQKNTHGHLVLDASDVEQRLDLLPQLPPRPGAELKVLPQIPLDDHEGQALLLELLVVLTSYVASDVSLHPGHDLAETLVAKLLHLTQNSGAEEYLFPSQKRGMKKATR